MKFYVFRVCVEGVPHGSDNFRDFAKGSVRILAFNCGLSVPEEERIGRNGSEEEKIRLKSVSLE